MPSMPSMLNIFSAAKSEEVGPFVGSPLTGISDHSSFRSLDLSHVGIVTPSQLEHMVAAEIFFLE